jgi:hypothetical protein
VLKTLGERWNRIFISIWFDKRFLLFTGGSAKVLNMEIHPLKVSSGHCVMKTIILRANCQFILSFYIFSRSISSSQQ